MNEHKIIIFYHGNCPDGFGGAYAAWKKFGESAEYVGLKHERPPTRDVAGKEVYFIDFCYAKPVMDDIVAKAKRVIVFDHHEGVEEVVKSMPEYIYDAGRSGATIAWSYFHPDTAVPAFLALVEKADRYQPLTDDERAIVTYSYVQPFTFPEWEALAARIEDEAGRNAIIERGRAYTEYFKLLIAQLANTAKLVSFEGYEVYLASGQRMFATELGAYLRKKKPPFALIIRADEDGGIRVSLRADSTVDVSKIAQKYGGNGHPGSAAFLIPFGTPLPWTVITSTSDENSRD